MLTLHHTPFIQKINDKLFEKKEVAVAVKREDVIHPYVSGNKWRKLHYNLEEAKAAGHTTLLTFGGAFSNHIYATATAAKEAGFQSIGIIRGDELAGKPLNKTLKFAQNHGMKLQFVDRKAYRKKTEGPFIEELHEKYGGFFLIPEGGTNQAAVKGCEAIVTGEVKNYDFVCCSVGTGGTLSGIVSGMNGAGKVIGFSALKGNFLKAEVAKLLEEGHIPFNNWQIMTDYHFGGYAKATDDLMEFKKHFERRHLISLDQVYTAKMMYGIYDLIKKGHFPVGSKILAVHTGGLQGNQITQKDSQTHH